MAFAVLASASLLPDPKLSKLEVDWGLLSLLPFLPTFGEIGPFIFAPSAELTLEFLIPPIGLILPLGGDSIPDRLNPQFLPLSDGAGSLLRFGDTIGFVPLDGFAGDIGLVLKVPVPKSEMATCSGDLYGLSGFESLAVLGLFDADAPEGGLGRLTGKELGSMPPGRRVSNGSQRG